MLGTLGCDSIERVSCAIDSPRAILLVIDDRFAERPGLSSILRRVRRYYHRNGRRHGPLESYRPSLSVGTHPA